MADEDRDFLQNNYSCSSEMDLIPISPEYSGDDFTPKRPRTTKGTTVMIPKDILSKLGPTADRLNLSGTQLAGIVAAVTNHRHPLSRRTSTVTWGRLTLMGSFCQDSEGLEKSTDWLSFSIRQVFYKFNKRTNFQSAQFQFYKTIVIL